MAKKTYSTVATNVLKNLPGSLPTTNIPEDVEPAEAAAPCVAQLEHLSIDNLTHDAIWRDSFSLTGTMRTFYSGPTIVAVWEKLVSVHHPHNFQLVEGSCRVANSGPDSSWIEAYFQFQLTGPLSPICSGFLSLVYDKDAGWKIWVLRTILERFRGFADVDVLPPQSPSTTLDPPAKTHYECIVFGGGQSGLSTGGRLKALGIDYLVIEKQENVGDSWKSRYDAAKCKLVPLLRSALQTPIAGTNADRRFMNIVHGTRHFAHLPFDRTFSSEYPLFPGKNDLARGYQSWVDSYGINIWLSTELKCGSWNERACRWEVKVVRHGKEVWLSADHVVFAVGGGGQIPVHPNYPGRDRFKGDVLHSSHFKSSAPWKGKRGIVIGTANTGHDMAEDMLEHGLSVTMIQRSPTYVIPLEYLSPVMDALYNEDSNIELSDRIQFSTPVVVTRLRSSKILHARTKADAERFDALERAGFKVERFGDFVRHVNERQGGHYIDVGASAKIANGLIKVKSDALPVGYTEQGLLFSDGKEVEADLILFATGFAGNLRQVVADVFGHEIADQLDDFWGMDAEGETNGAFKPSGHPRLWYMGGGCGHSRYFSRFIALQVKAALLGHPLAVYSGLPSVEERR